MKKTSLNEQMVWDGEKGVVIVLQTPTQLQGPVFESGDCVNAGVLERQWPPNGRPAITIITFDQKTKKKGTSGVMGI